MKVLVIGQGGREHAIIMALNKSPSIREIHAAPGNDGMQAQAICHPITWKETEKIISLCLKSEIDYVIIGPEDPLVDGLSDRLRERGILVVGPSAQGARLEGSKVFCKNFLLDAGIPTARSKTVNSVIGTMEAAKNFTPPYVLKADGLAAGKGVLICHTLEQLRSGAEDFFERKTLGLAAASALLEQFTPGWELSCLILTNGKEYQMLPFAQDYKRLLDNDEGPNTGGMGTIAPLQINKELTEQIEQKIIQPTLAHLQKQNIIYRGVIFFGLMITDSGPSLLEINCRFGDPETQVVLPLIENDFGKIMQSIATGLVPKIQIRQLAAACVVMASPGYPYEPQKGVRIIGSLEQQTANSYFISAGVKKIANDHWVTDGGRAVCAIGVGNNKKEALQNAYSQRQLINWDGVLFRTDIGKNDPDITMTNEH